MQVLIVYESHFGNTRRVAAAIARGLPAGATAELVDIDSAPPLDQVRADLLIIGAPTHVFGLSRPDSRREALEQAGLPDGARRGIREWLAQLPAGLPPVAVYDTRTLESRLPGSAARAVARRLRRAKVTMVGTPANFAVHGIEGPLAPGEEERAAAWARGLLTEVPTDVAPG